MPDLNSEQSENCDVEKELGLDSILKQAMNLKNEMSNTVKGVNETIKGLQNDMEYYVFGPRSNNNMSIGKESASLLIDLKQNAENMFMEVATIYTCDLSENSDMDHAHEDIRELRRFHDKMEKLKKNLKFVSISIKKISQDMKSDRMISNGNHDTTRKGILNSTSASEFSFMAKNRATSSPIPEHNIDK